MLILNTAKHSAHSHCQESAEKHSHNHRHQSRIRLHPNTHGNTHSPTDIRAQTIRNTHLQHCIQEAAHFSATLPKLYITKNATISKRKNAWRQLSEVSKRHLIRGTLWENILNINAYWKWDFSLTSGSYMWFPRQLFFLFVLMGGIQ